MSVMLGSVLELTLFNVFIKSLEYGAKCIIITSVNKAKLGGMASVLDSRAAIQRYLKKLEEWLNRNLVKFSKVKCQTLLLRQSIAWHQCKLVTDWLQTVLQKRN